MSVLLAGCAAPSARLQTAAPAAASPGGPQFATIDSIRPIAAAAAVAGGDPRAQVLDAMGIAPRAPAGAVEFVLLTDDGQTLSVVQANADRLTQGERVILVPGAQPRVTPAGGVPAS